MNIKQFIFAIPLVMVSSGVLSGEMTCSTKSVNSKVLTRTATATDRTTNSATLMSIKTGLVTPSTDPIITAVGEQYRPGNNDRLTISMNFLGANGATTTGGWSWYPARGKMVNPDWDAKVYYVFTNFNGGGPNDIYQQLMSRPDSSIDNSWPTHPIVATTTGTYIASAQTFTVTVPDIDFYLAPPSVTVPIAVSTILYTYMWDDRPNIFPTFNLGTETLTSVITASCTPIPLQLTVAPILDVDFGNVTMGTGAPETIREFSIKITSGTAIPAGTITITADKQTPSGEIALGTGVVRLTDKNTGNPVKLGVATKINARDTTISATLDASAATPGSATANLLISLEVS